MMRAIIIDEKDARALLDKLKLESMTKDIPRYGVDMSEAWTSIPQHLRNSIIDEVHRKFHYVVCQWLQDQGANVVR